MTFEYPLAFNAVKFIAVMARIGAFTMAFPFFSGKVIPMQVQIMFVFVISVVLFPVVPDQWLTQEVFQNLDLMNLSFIVLSEMFLGLLISLFVMIFMEILEFAGFIIDRELGYNMGEMIDPASEANTSLFSFMLLNTFIMIFLITDCHHEVMRLAAYSFETIPPGQFYMSENLVDAIIKTSVQIFVTGFQLAMPVFVAMLLINIAMGIMTRIGEDFPVMMLSFPVKFAIGFMIVAAIFPTISAICRSLCEELLDQLALVVRL